jgi:hypothetical protein
VCVFVFVCVKERRESERESAFVRACARVCVRVRVRVRRHGHCTASFSSSNLHGWGNQYEVS